MQVADRERFETAFGVLCAGFNQPATKARKDAFWSGLRKMPIQQFERLVDVSLGEQGLEDFPSPNQLWRLYRLASDPERSAAAAPVSDPDHLEYFAKRLLFQHLSTRGGSGSSGTFVAGVAKHSGITNAGPSLELRVCLDFKRQLVDEWVGYVREGDPDATVAEFLRRWIVGLSRISDVTPRALVEWERFRDDPRSNATFAPHMARDLHLAGELA